MIGKIGMLIGAAISIIMFVLSPSHNNPMVVLNAIIGYVVMIICFIIWNSVCADEDRESAEHSKYFKWIIASNYAVATMDNCVIALYGDTRYCALLYIFYMAVFISFAMMFWSLGMYSLSIIGEKSRNVKFYSRTYHILTGIHLILILSTPITKLYFYVDEFGIIQFPRTYPLAGIYAALILILNLIYIVKNGKSRLGRNILFSCTFAWALGVVLDSLSVFEYVEFFSSDVMLGLIFSVGVLWIFCGIYSKQKHDMLKQKEELTNLRLNAMIAQIEPHFIFNTLGTIDSLCVEDTERARTVIGMFSDYLRVNYHSITLHHTCPIEQEIENLKTYTEIEQIRFGRLNVCYDVQETGFMIPSFTLQPLVENAIKHGICAKKKSAGTVTVRTYSDDKDYIISISDDGVGFDKDSVQDGKVHVGIQNVEQRLNILCGGSLVIDSEVGKGTTCIIRVPREHKGA
ncbi:MAG: histidine kinase [Lachnospiraceae bacterium]|nr:histidine kinase [Lachnospiraceae bacterium]